MTVGTKCWGRATYAALWHRQTLCTWFSKDCHDILSLEERNFFALTSEGLFISLQKQDFLIFAPRDFKVYRWINSTSSITLFLKNGLIKLCPLHFNFWLDWKSDLQISLIAFLLWQLSSGWQLAMSGKPDLKSVIYMLPNRHIWTGVSCIYLQHFTINTDAEESVHSFSIL